MEKFIYVFKTDDRNKLVSFGYELLKNDEENNIFVFNNDSDHMNFNFNDMFFVTCDTLTF